MSTSLLYHAWGIRGYRHDRTQYEGGVVVYRIKHSPQEVFRCSGCGSPEVVRRGKVLRRWRSLPIGLKPVFIEMEVQRVACRDCALTRQVKVVFSEARLSYTRAFERYAVELARQMTIQAVAHHLRVGWDTIKDMVKRNLKRRYANPPLKDLRWIAIDEIAVRKGHHYMTVVMNLETGAAVFAGNGKGVDALKPFWKLLKRARAKPQAVAIDMSPAYQAAVRANLPQAAIVFDHFHLVQWVNLTLSDLRKATQQTATAAQRKVVKGLRWILLKNPENLDEGHRERERLEEALELNKALATGYYLKEDLRQLWNQPNKTAGRRFLQGWMRRARMSGIALLKKLANSFSRHADGILAWFDYPISTGPLEGFNNKIKTMKRQAYGYRDLEFFKLKILALHEAKYALIG
jgi:transposase